MGIRACLIPIVLITAILPVATGQVPFNRAMYGNWNYTLLAQLGFDATYENKLWNMGPEKALDSFARESLEAEEHNLTYICGLYYLMGQVPFDDYTRAVTESGEVLSRTPSPGDETYWRRVIEEPALAIANLSLHYPIWGIAWDFELYGGEDFDGWDYSYDTESLTAFANDTGATIPELEPADRYPYLVQNDLLQDYKDWLMGRAYNLALATRERVDDINPNLSMGIVAFASSWFYWNILDGFETPDAPITAWCEDTYRAYEEETVEKYRLRFAEHDVDGLFLPGFYTGWIDPWGVLEWMEAATRHHGSFWAYQFDTSSFKLAPQEEYLRAYNIFHDVFLQGQKMAPIKPSFTIYPFVEARPYGDDRMALMLLPSQASSQIAEGIELLTESSIVYIGENLTEVEIEGEYLPVDQLPCVVYGLSQTDLDRAEASGGIVELGELLGYCEGLDIPTGSLVDQLDLARADYETGRYDLSADRIRNTVPGAYRKVMDAIYPMVQQGMENPRQSQIPLSSLTRLSTAHSMFEEGNEEEGTLLLLNAMSNWSKSIDELSVASLCLLALIAARSRVRRG